MNTKIALIQEIYKLDENDLQLRKEALKKIAPYVDEIMDTFYEKLLQKEEFAHFIPLDIISELKQKQIKFIEVLLSTPFDETMYKKIVKVGVVHYHIKLDPIYMSYGYHLLSELILTQSKKDPTLLPYLKLVIKYLKVADAIMSHEYFSQKSLTESPYKANNLFIAINKLQSAFITYRNSLVDFQASAESESSFQETLDVLNEYREELAEININLNTIKRFHTEFRHQKDEKTFLTLQNTLQRPLNDLSVTTYLTTGSALALIRAMSDTIYNKIIINKEELALNDVKQNIFTMLTQNFAWAVENISFFDEEPQESYEILKHLMHEQKVFFLGVNIKDISNKLYVAEMIDLLCETIKITLYLNSKEL